MRSAIAFALLAVAGVSAQSAADSAPASTSSAIHIDVCGETCNGVAGYISSCLYDIKLSNPGCSTLCQRNMTEPIKKCVKCRDDSNWEGVVGGLDASKAGEIVNMCEGYQATLPSQASTTRPATTSAPAAVTTPLTTVPPQSSANPFASSAAAPSGSAAVAGSQSGGASGIPPAASATKSSGSRTAGVALGAAVLAGAVLLL